MTWNDKYKFLHHWKIKFILRSQFRQKRAPNLLANKTLKRVPFRTKNLSSSFIRMGTWIYLIPGWCLRSYGCWVTSSHRHSRHHSSQLPPDLQTLHIPSLEFFFSIFALNFFLSHIHPNFLIHHWKNSADSVTTVLLFANTDDLEITPTDPSYLSWLVHAASCLHLSHPSILIDIGQLWLCLTPTQLLTDPVTQAQALLFS